MMYGRNWRRVVIAGAFFITLAPATGFAFPESTETDGELPTDVNGVWLLVNQLEFPRVTPEPSPATTPAPGGSPAAGSAPAGATAAAPTVAASPASAAPAPAAGAPGTVAGATGAQTAGQGPVRYFGVPVLLKIEHLPKAEAQARRDAETKMQEDSVAKANKLIEEDTKKSIPVQTETGEVEGAPTVLVPLVPLNRLGGTGDDVDIYLLDVDFPKVIQDSVTKAQKAEKPWVPTDKEIALLRSSWSSLKTSKRDEYSKVDWKVVSPDKYDDGLKEDPTTKDAKFAITSTQLMIPKPGVPEKNIMIYGVREFSDGKMSGTHVRAMMANSPFPLPIEMRGTFTMYKVADLPKAKGAKAPAAKPKVAN